MDWFEKLTGFREVGYDATRARLAIHGDRLRSDVNGATYGIGRLELASLESLRERVSKHDGPAGKIAVGHAFGDVRRMHQSRENAGALFQVASQFNLLEMVGPQISPEHGVTRYQNDQTQGPACAIAAGAATIYRNYFAPVAGEEGQTSERQLNGLADLTHALAAGIGWVADELVQMDNGYAFFNQPALDVVTKHLREAPAAEIDWLRGKLRIGLHWDVEVTEATGPLKPIVSQAFCSALPVAYSNVEDVHWKPLAILVLEAAYEATLLSAVLNVRRGTSNIVLLTQLGGGAFGNRPEWIHLAIRRALKLVEGCDLSVKLVSWGEPSPTMEELVVEFA